MFTPTDKAAYRLHIQKFARAANEFAAVINDNCDSTFAKMFQEDYPFGDIDFDSMVVNILGWKDTQLKLVEENFPSGEYTEEQLNDIEAAMYHFHDLPRDQQQAAAHEYQSITGLSDEDLERMADTLEEEMEGTHSNKFYMWYHLNKMGGRVKDIGFSCKCSIIDIVDDASRYDDVEVHPVRQNRDEDGGTHCEQCEEGEHDMFSVYLHLKEGGLECIADFSCKSEAGSFASIVLKFIKNDTPLGKELLESAYKSMRGEKISVPQNELIGDIRRYLLTEAGYNKG